MSSRLLLLPGASLLANGQLNGSASKNGHKDDGSLRSQGLDGGEDGPVKKRLDAARFYRRVIRGGGGKTGENGGAAAPVSASASAH